MKRRDFLKAAAPATILPFLVGGYSVKAFANNPFLNSLLPAGTPTDRVLVLIQLIGGNDGLNTLIPLDQYPAMMAARSNITIDESTVLKLTSLQGFHPLMTGMQTLYNQGKMAIVQNVGYPNPNFSHFRSTDIWLTGANYDQLLSTGWIGRYLDQEYPGYPTGYPNAQTPDPIGIQIGTGVSLAFEGQNANLGMAFSDASAFYDIINDTITPTANTRAGFELAYVRSIGQQLQTFSVPVSAAATKGKTLSTQWPAANTNSLADQLRIVAQLIAGGLQTKIYVVSLGGFDSHAGQRAAQDPLLGKLSSAISAFQDELRLNTLEDRVIGMTFSEFGRRIKSNDSGGTDHGAAAPMFVFGSKVIPGIQGSNPVLPANATVDDNIPMEVDFRTIYASVLKEWFGTSDTEINTTLLNSYSTIPIIQSATVAPGASSAAALELNQNYPNPCGPSISKTTQIGFKTNGGFTSLHIYDTKGDLISALVDNIVTPGKQTVTFNTEGLASGNYFYRLESGGAMLTRSMVVLK